MRIFQGVVIAVLILSSSVCFAGDEQSFFRDGKELNYLLDDLSGISKSGCNDQIAVFVMNEAIRRFSGIRTSLLHELILMDLTVDEQQRIVAGRFVSFDIERRIKMVADQSLETGDTCMNLTKSNSLVLLCDKFKVIVRRCMEEDERLVEKIRDQTLVLDLD